jgi:hypothetical protein
MLLEIGIRLFETDYAGSVTNFTGCKINTSIANKLASKSLFLLCVCSVSQICISQNVSQNQPQISLTTTNFQTLLGLKADQKPLSPLSDNQDGTKWLLLFYSTDSVRQSAKSKLALFQLGVWRSLSSNQQHPTVKVGTIDCALEQSICSRFGIVYQPELMYYQGGNSQVLDPTVEITSKNIQRLLDVLQTLKEKQSIGEMQASPLGLLVRRLQRWFTVTILSYSRPSVLLGNFLLLAFIIFSWTLVRSLLDESSSMESEEEKQARGSASENLEASA